MLEKIFFILGKKILPASGIYKSQDCDNKTKKIETQIPIITNATFNLSRSNA